MPAQPQTDAERNHPSCDLQAERSAMNQPTELQDQPQMTFAPSTSCMCEAIRMLACRVWWRLSFSPSPSIYGPQATLTSRFSAAAPSRRVDSTEAEGCQQQPAPALHRSQEEGLPVSYSHSCVRARQFPYHSTTSLGQPLHHSTRRNAHTSSHCYSTRRGQLSSLEDAKEFLVSLPVPQRTCLEKAIMETKKGEAEPEVVTPPTWNQLKLCE